MCGVWGALRPQFHTELNMLITGDNRATVLSAENLLANMIISVVLPPLGAIHDALSFSTAVFVSAPLIFGIYSVVRHVPPRPPAHSIFLLSPSLFLLLSPSLPLSFSLEHAELTATAQLHHCLLLLGKHRVLVYWQRLRRHDCGSSPCFPTLHADGN